MSKSVLARSTLFWLSLPAIMQGFTHTIAGQVLPGMYAKYFGLELATIGTAVLLLKIFDGVTDPLIGYASDVHRRVAGSRKPWVLGGSALSALSVWFLLQPGDQSTIWYFTGWFLLTYLGWTVAEIPYRAWTLELSTDYSTRTRIAVWVLVAGLLGAIALFLIPVLGPILGYAEGSEFSPDSLSIAAWVSVIMLPLCALVTTRAVPDGDAPRETVKEPLGDVVRSIVKNRPLLMVNVALLLHGLAGGMTNGVAFLYVDVYLGLGDRLAVLLLITVPMAVLAAPFWGWLSSRMEKHRTWAIAAIGGALASFSLGLVSPGETVLPVLGVLMILNFIFGSAIGVLVPSLLGDVVDYGRLKFGRDRAGAYYAFFTLIQKAIVGLGAAVAMLLAQVFGFDAMATSQTASGAIGIKLAYAWVPALISAAAVPILWRFPITRKNHSQIVAELEAREEQETQCFSAKSS